ncbi:DUF2510 domain-containing protein [Fodinicola feengrottensis]|uniref:DUF2510 domain-containing protein n=1 Tax=Fodinicola feengrottensis TaxID=435914 RepID=UPI0013D2F489|nr:DUF2510 domain-containing protein [Fodinicola feengrottensis]
MTTPGWYKDPAEPDVRRYWDGEQWIGGDGVPADTAIPTEPPVDEKPRYGVKEPVLAPFGPESFGPERTAQSPAGWGVPVGGTSADGRPTGYPAQPGFPPAGAFKLPLGTLPGDVPAQALASVGERLAARVIDIMLVGLLNVVVNGWFVYQYISQPYWQQVADAMTAAAKGQAIDPPTATTTVSWLAILIMVIARSGSGSRTRCRRSGTAGRPWASG